MHNTHGDYDHRYRTSPDNCTNDHTQHTIHSTTTHTAHDHYEHLHYTTLMTLHYNTPHPRAPLETQTNPHTTL